MNCDNLLYEIVPNDHFIYHKRGPLTVTIINDMIDNIMHIMFNKLLKNFTPLSYILLVYFIIFCPPDFKSDSSKTFFSKFKRIYVADKKLIINIVEYIQQITDLIVDEEDKGKSFLSVYNREKNNKAYIDRMNNNLNLLLIDNVYKILQETVIFGTSVFTTLFCMYFFDYVIDTTKYTDLFKNLILHLTNDAKCDLFYKNKSLVFTNTYLHFCPFANEYDFDNKIPRGFARTIEILRQICLDVDNDYNNTDYSDVFVFEHNTLFSEGYSIYHSISSFFIFEYTYNNKKQLLIPIAINNKLYLKIVDDTNPLTVIDLMMLNHESLLYNFIDTDDMFMKNTYDYIIDECFKHIGWYLEKNVDNDDDIKYLSIRYTFGDDLNGYDFRFESYIHSALLSRMFINFNNYSFIKLLTEKDKSIEISVIQFDIVYKDSNMAFFRDKDDTIRLRIQINITMKACDYTDIITYDVVLSSNENKCNFTSNYIYAIGGKHENVNVYIDKLNNMIFEKLKSLHTKVIQWGNEITTKLNEYCDRMPKIYYRGSYKDFNTEYMYYYDKLINDDKYSMNNDAYTFHTSINFYNDFGSAKV